MIAFWPLRRAVAAVHPGVLYITLPGVLYITLLALVRALSLSLSALYGTLAYFSVQAHKAGRQAPVAA